MDERTTFMEYLYNLTLQLDSAVLNVLFGVTIITIRCDPGFAGRTPASGAGPLYRESTFRATPADRVREQALLDRQAARDRTAMRLYIGLACLTLAGLVASILWYFGIIQRWYATYTG